MAGQRAHDTDMHGADGRPAPDAGQAGHADRGERLAELIVAHAVRAGLGPGGRLPTERQLAADLGVTRSTIRYALGLLEAEGHISREVGRGTYLRSPGAPGIRGDAPARGGAAADGPGAGQASTGHASTGQASTGHPGTGRAAFAPADVMMVRRLLEPPAMPLAVAWATAADFDEMDRCLTGGDEATSYEEFEAWDLALHRSIIAATHSPLLVTLYSSVEDARHGHMWGDLKRRSASAERRRLYQADHHEIVAAIKTRDSAAGMAAMRAHLSRVSDHLNATDPFAGIYQ